MESKKAERTVETRKIFGTNRSVVALGVARMADSVGNSFLIVVLPLYIASQSVTGDTFGLSTSLITGIVLSLFGVVSSITQPFVGRLSDKTGKRKLFVIIGLVLFFFANAAFTFADTYVSLLVVRAVQGVGAALTITSSVALVSEVSTNSNRGNNMGVFNTLRLIGFGVGPLLSGVLIEAGPYNLPIFGETSGFNAAFYIASASALLSIILVMWLVKDSSESKPSQKPLKIRVLSKEKGKVLDPIFALALATLIMSIGFSLLAPIETETNERLSQGPFLFSVEFTAMVAALALVQPLVGRLSDKYGRKIFIISGMICLIPFTLAQGFATEPWHMITARALQGVSASMVFAPALALAGDLAEKGQAGSQLSLLTMAFGIGISIGALLAGYAVGFGYLTPFAVGACMAAVGVVVVSTQIAKKI
ncbi:MFS transporter [Cryomorpha ignava]|uniref:MFS transporter n=1 Tax=Cryomorpha ignava TaxID=101383 RepID=A0A7K3WKQ6_9FLAO|nr:MFS transporter [Cryomorpha ignava]NEN22219.1 MFS transporter [Cryomorpha ignava]